MTDRFKFRIPMFTDKGTFQEFQYLELGDWIEGTLCGYNGDTQQCTGLKDINGKLIYEGDIVQETSIDGIYKIGYKKCAFYLESEDHICYFHELAKAFSEKRLKLIGNIYENEELIQ